MGILWFIWYLFLAVFIVAALYTLATYLIRKYDQHLCLSGVVSPPYAEPELMPKGAAKWRGIMLEVIATMAFIWLYPLGMWGARTPLPRRGNHDGRPILLVHGYNHNRSGWTKIRRKLIHAGLGPVYAFNLPSKKPSIEAYAAAVADEAKRIREETGMDHLVLIGHSMGGLVSSYYAEDLAPAGTITYVITIGSPLGGTRTAVMAGSQAARQMRNGSPLVTSLRKKIVDNRSTEYRHIATRLDNIILPYQSSLIGKCPEHELCLPNLGHMSLLFSDAVAKQIINWLKVKPPVRQASKKQPAEQPAKTIPASA